MMPHDIWTERTRILLKSGTEIERRFWIGLSDTPELDKFGRVLIAPMLRSGANSIKRLLCCGRESRNMGCKEIRTAQEIIRAKNE